MVYAIMHVCGYRCTVLHCIALLKFCTELNFIICPVSYTVLKQLIFNHNRGYILVVAYSKATVGVVAYSSTTMGIAVGAYYSERSGYGIWDANAERAG